MYTATTMSILLCNLGMQLVLASHNHFSGAPARSRFAELPTKSVVHGMTIIELQLQNSTPLMIKMYCASNHADDPMH